MAEQRDEKKEKPLSLQERVEIAERDIQELARGINTHAMLLESIVVASDRVVQKYLALMRVAEGEKEGQAQKPEEKK